jgi:phthiocerol/phenolphthiocerol synthesis type-I polyketide synthase E
MNAIDPDTSVAITGAGYRFNGQAGSIDRLVRSLASDAARHATIANEELFDPKIFGLDVRTCAFLDPQHRIFLECALEALHDGDCAPPARGTIGVYGACAPSSYFLRAASRLRRAEDLTQLRRGTDKDYLPALVSRTLGLTGPSIAVQSACASGLVATHTACQALLGGECDAALAGAVSLVRSDLACLLSDEPPLVDGCGVILLRPLRSALDRGDAVHAVILGSALGHGGGHYPGLADARAVRDVTAGALAAAELDADEVDYVEIHAVADTVAARAELGALRQVYAPTADRPRFGSIKSEIGYPGVAAGMAGLLSAIAAVSGDYPVTELDALGARMARATSPSRPRIAGINGIGMTGTHAHLLLSTLASPRREPARGSAPLPAYERVRCWLD